MSSLVEIGPVVAQKKRKFEKVRKITLPYNGHISIRKVHLSLWLRRAKTWYCFQLCLTVEK